MCPVARRIKADGAIRTGSNTIIATLGNIFAKLVDRRTEFSSRSARVTPPRRIYLSSSRSRQEIAKSGAKPLQLRDRPTCVEHILQFGLVVDGMGPDDLGEITVDLGKEGGHIHGGVICAHGSS